jgi:hypothetical protein
METLRLVCEEDYQGICDEPDETSLLIEAVKSQPPERKGERDSIKLMSQIEPRP